MSLIEGLDARGEVDPIDLVERIATYHDWEFDRIADDQIAMAVEGQWRTYSITLAWSHSDEVLRLVSTFELEPPEDRIPALHALMNLINDGLWAGGFTWWEGQDLLVWRYGLSLAGGLSATAEQVDRMIRDAVAHSERFYPAFQLTVWGGQEPLDAMQVAIAEAYGRA